MSTGTRHPTPRSRGRRARRRSSSATPTCARWPSTAARSSPTTAGRFDEALEWVQRPLDFVDELNDPERVVEVYEATVPVDVILGRFKAARAMSDLHAGRDAAALSPTTGCTASPSGPSWRSWAASGRPCADMTPRIEQTVAENLQTPCVRNERSLLICAAASRILGDIAESERLEAKAESLGMEGYDQSYSSRRACGWRCTKDDRGAVERLITSFPSSSEPHAFVLVQPLGAGDAARSPRPPR